MNNYFNNIELIILDELGSSIADIIAKIEKNYHLDNRLTICIGNLASIGKSIENIGIFKDFILTITCWLDKIYVHCYNNVQGNCQECFINTIKKQNNFKSNPYFIINSITYSPSILFNIVLIAFESIANKINWFINGSKIFIFSLNQVWLTTKYLYPTLECVICNPFERSTVPVLYQENNISAISAIRTFPIHKFTPILDQFCDNAIGLVKDISFDLQLPVASCTAKLQLNSETDILTLGRAKNFIASRNIAILEVLERLSGLRGSAGVKTVVANYEQFLEKAINPIDFCLHDENQYSLNNYPFVKFYTNKPLSWVKGLDIKNNTEIWVPISMAFYGFKYNSIHEMYAFESSNGCAIGSSYTEAALSAILEVIERDSFLFSWYKKKPLEDITEFILDSDEVTLVYEKFRLYSKASIHFYNSTTESGIPSIFCLAICHQPNSPAFSAAAGAGINFYEAAKSALYELSCHFIRLQYLLARDGEKKRALEMLSNSFKVRKMEDHGLVNCLAEASYRFNFLLDSKIEFSKNEILKLEISQTFSPEQTLEVVTKKLFNANFDIIVIDQTPEFLIKKNLFCVKVLISHMLPITFGYTYARLNTKRLCNEEKNFLETYPHPFP